MALPSSGVLTLADIQTEFGGTNPIDLSEYYRGGGLVPDSGPNAAIPTSGVISVSDFYGAANLINLDFTVQGTLVTRTAGTYSGVSIGTANTNRMVVISSSGGSSPSSVTIGGITATIVNGPSSAQYFAYAKVPTGTTATIVLTGNTSNTQQIYTFNTVNTAPTNSLVSTTSVPANTNGTSTFTQNPVATESVFMATASFFGPGPGSGPQPGTGIYTTNPNGVTYVLGSTLTAQAAIGATAMGYSVCTTTDSRNMQTKHFNNPSKGIATMRAIRLYFEAN